MMIAQFVFTTGTQIASLWTGLADCSVWALASKIATVLSCVLAICKTPYVCVFSDSKREQIDE